MTAMLQMSITAWAEKINDIFCVLRNSSPPRRITAIEVQLQNNTTACEPAVTATVIAKTSVPEYRVIVHTIKKETRAAENWVRILNK